MAVRRFGSNILIFAQEMRKWAHIDDKFWAANEIRFWIESVYVSILVIPIVSDRIAHDCEHTYEWVRGIGQETPSKWSNREQKKHTTANRAPLSVKKAWMRFAKEYESLERLLELEPYEIESLVGTLWSDTYIQNKVFSG